MKWTSINYRSRADWSRFFSVQRGVSRGRHSLHAEAGLPKLDSVTDLPQGYHSSFEPRIRICLSFKKNVRTKLSNKSNVSTAKIVLVVGTQSLRLQLDNSAEGRVLQELPSKKEFPGLNLEQRIGGAKTKRANSQRQVLPPLPLHSGDAASVSYRAAGTWAAPKRKSR